MGGDIGVHSEIGKGSTFFFYVKLGISNSPGSSRSSSVSPDRGRLETMWEQLRGIRVLICEVGFPCSEWPEVLQSSLLQPWLPILAGQ